MSLERRHRLQVGHRDRPWVRAGDAPSTDSDRFMAAAAYVYLALGATWAVGAALVSAGEPSATMMSPVAISALAALFLGPRVNAARRTRPWRLLAFSAVAFTISLGLRPGQLGEDAALPVAATLVAITGYVLVLTSALSFLRDHRDDDRGSLADSLLVASGAVAPTVVFLIAPAISRTGVTSFTSLAAGLFPIFDVMLCYLLMRLTLSLPARPPAMRLLLTSALMVLIGDLGWALVAAGALELPVATLDIPFSFSFITIAAACMHPSMRQLTIPTVRRLRPLRSGRHTVIVTALIAPALVVATTDLTTPLVRFSVAGSIVAGAVIAAQRARRAVDKHAANEESLAFMATHDVLTELPNRRLALERIQMDLGDGHVANGERVAALFVDVDRFKLINDTWGHPVGDEFLLAAAKRLRERLDPRHLIAHMSGDEFLVVARGTDCGFAETIAQHVLECFEQPFRLSTGDVMVTVSVGVALASPQRTTADDLVRDADIAVYRAKANGRNGFAVFDASMHRLVTERYSLEHDLRLAVERREFTVHYQPIVDINTGRVMGFEALLRWDRPGHGPVKPRTFVPLLEELDLIIEVGHFVMKQALDQLAEWQRAGLDVYVSINVAARQIHRGGLVEHVGRLLDESKVPPSRLLLELTESLLIEESPVVRETMDGLTLLGVQLAIDDFGTGHSSLQYLTRFPVSAVKVDGSFIQALGYDSDSSAIVQAVVAMSHALGMTVIAEGVETPAQRAHVARLGCDAVQGFSEGRPDEATSFSTTAWLPPVVTAYSDVENGSHA